MAAWKAAWPWFAIIFAAVLCFAGGVLIARGEPLWGLALMTLAGLMFQVLRWSSLSVDTFGWIVAAQLVVQAFLILSVRPLNGPLDRPQEVLIVAGALTFVLLAAVSAFAYHFDATPVSVSSDKHNPHLLLQYPYTGFNRLSLVAAVAMYLLVLFWTGVLVLQAHDSVTFPHRSHEGGIASAVLGVVVLHASLLALTTLGLLCVLGQTPATYETVGSGSFRSSPLARRLAAAGIVAALFVADGLVVYRGWAVHLNQSQWIVHVENVWRIKNLPFGNGVEGWRRLLLVLSAVSSMWIPFLLVALPSIVLPRPGQIRSKPTGLPSLSPDGRDGLPSWLPQRLVLPKIAAWMWTEARQPLNAVRTLAISFVQARFWLRALFVDSNAAAGYAISLGLLLGLTPVADWIGWSTQSFGGYTAISAWLAATTAWAIPFGRGLLFIDESCARAYQTMLHRELQQLTGHTLILGNGPIGQRFLHDLTARNLLRYDTRRDHQGASRNILQANGRLAKLLTRIAIVDSDTKRDSVLTPSGARVSVVKLDSVDEEVIDCLVPVIVGDVGDRLPELARFDKASFVVCAMPPSDDREPSQVVLNHLVDLARRRKKYVPAILVTYSSDIAPHLVSRIVDHRLPAHYILPEHLEGLSAADVAHAAFEKLRALGPVRVRPVLIVCGREDRARQVIDGFLKHLTTDLMTRLSQGDDPTVILMPGRSGSGQALTLRSRQLLRWMTSKQLVGSALCITERFISRLVTRHTSDSKTVYADDKTIFVPVIDEPSNSEDVWLTVLKLIDPDIIVFSDPDTDAELSAMEAAVTAINRRATETTAPAKLPMLVVSGESGRRGVTQQFENVLVYYSSLWDRYPPEQFPAPGMAVRRESPDRFAGDFLVDVIGDPVERMVGVFRAYDVYARRGRGATTDRVPVELEFCAPDRPGIIAATLAALSGVQLVSDLARERPTLGNTKITIQDDGTFALRAFAYLDDRNTPSDTAGFTRLTLTPGDQGRGGDHDVRGIVSSLLKRNRHAEEHAAAAAALKGFCETREQSFSAAQQKFMPLNQRFQDQLRTCCGMPGCPVEAMHKIIKAGEPTVARNMIQDPTKRMKHAKALVDHFMVDECDVDEQVPRTLPFAVVSAIIKGDQDGSSGNLAVGMNELQLRDTAPAMSIGNGRVFQPTYVSAYECHDERFAVFSCYGALIERRAETRDSARKSVAITQLNAIEEVTIKPITQGPRWEGYATRLCTYLRRGNNTYAFVKSAGLDGVRFTVSRHN